MGNSSEFIFVKAETTHNENPKRSGWSHEPFNESTYEPREDEEKEWISKDMKSQIWGTVTSLQSKPLVDKENVFVVIGVENRLTYNEDKSKIKKQVLYTNTLNLLERIKADILCYLDADHTKMLVSCRISDLTDLLNRRSFRKKYFQSVKRISLLLTSELISETLRKNMEWSRKPRKVFIELMPNVKREKRNEYATSLIELLKKKGQNQELRSCCNEEFIIANLDSKSTKELLEDCNFVFRVGELPKTKLQRVSSKATASKKKSIKASAASAGSKSQQNELPIICVLDSGVNRIPQLKGLLVRTDKCEEIFSAEDDYPKHGHGTPVAYLASFGENDNIPKARIISYKIYSDFDASVFFEGYHSAMTVYSNKYQPLRSRIFVSSIAFEDYDDEITASIDRWIQENNICAIFAAGNIDLDRVEGYAMKGIQCSSYVEMHPIKDPAQAVNAIAVGAIAKEQSATRNSISKPDELSPFTRCGTLNGCLYDCKKPEFVEHGGNVCRDGTEIGVTSVSKKGDQIVNGFVGTSFAAPIFANYVAQIEAKYGKKIRNAETLKAIALALSNGQLLNCKGYGETTSPDDFRYDIRSLVCAEGDIPLSDKLSVEGFNLDYSGKVTVGIPNGVGSIKMFLVHSDNHFRDVMPHLNTYLRVRATKIPKDTGDVQLLNPSENKRRSNMKVFQWKFGSHHPMGGVWTFHIAPEVTIPLVAKHLKNTTVRYGCAILFNSNRPTRHKTMTEDTYDFNKLIGAII